jgi:hypothetical protein
LESDSVRPRQARYLWEVLPFHPTFERKGFSRRIGTARCTKMWLRMHGTPEFPPLLTRAFLHGVPRRRDAPSQRACQIRTRCAAKRAMRLDTLTFGARWLYRTLRFLATGVAGFGRRPRAARPPPAVSFKFACAAGSNFPLAAMASRSRLGTKVGSRR